MTAAIILYDHVNPTGAFDKKSQIDVKGMLSIIIYMGSIYGVQKNSDFSIFVIYWVRGGRGTIYQKLFSPYISLRSQLWFERLKVVLSPSTGEKSTL